MTGERGKRYGPRFCYGGYCGHVLGILGGRLCFLLRMVWGWVWRVEGVERTRVVFPAIGVQSIGECVEVNFGYQPFQFDLQGYVLSRN